MSTFSSRHEIRSVTIANAASLSDAATLNGLLLVGVVMPASWTAANLTFQASVDGTNYFDVYDDSGVERTITAAASRFILIPATDLMSAVKLKVRSGTTGTPVTQGGSRVITLVLHSAS